MSKRGQIPQVRGQNREVRVFISGVWLRPSGPAPHDHPPHGGEDGGAYRDRTDDLKLAKLALSQLS
jgi:hypothetical protein